MSDAYKQAIKTRLAQINTAKGLLSQDKIHVPPPTHFYVPKYMFTGNSMELRTQLDIRSNGNYTDSTEVKINVKGLQTNQPNLCLHVVTGIFTCFLLPLCLMWTDCYRKKAEAIYEIKADTYKKLAVLNANNTLKYLQLTITDNYFNKQKAMILYNMLCESRCTGFIFVNQAMDVNMDDREYSDFDEYMKIFKTIPNLQVNMKWENKIIT